MSKVQVNNLIGSIRDGVDKKGNTIFSSTGELSDNIGLKFNKDHFLATLKEGQVIPNDLIKDLVISNNTENPNTPVQFNPDRDYYVAFAGDNGLDNGPELSMILNTTRPIAETSYGFEKWSSLVK